MFVIFDLDGTLYQTEYGVLSAVRETADHFGIKPLSDIEIIGNIGKTTEKFLEKVFPQIKITDDITGYFGIAEKNGVKNCGMLFNGIEELLGNLKKRGHSLFICSNGSEEYINLVLESTKIAKYLDGTKSAKRCSSKSGALKSIIGGSKNAVFVGDTIYDIEAAKENGIPSVAVTYGYGELSELSGSTFFAETPEEIAGHISTTDVFYKIARELVYGGKRVIGINGVDTSGKTLFADNFARFLTALNIKNEIIHIDDFHNPLEIRNRGENEMDAYYNNAFNYEQIINEILEPLKRNGSIDKEILCLNLDTDKYENTKYYRIDKETVLLIEGVLLFRPPLAEYLDGKVFLHIDFDEVIKRAALRDIPKHGEAFLERYKNKYIPVQQRYLSEYEPEKNCDVFINNNDYHNPRF